MTKSIHFEIAHFNMQPITNLLTSWCLKIPIGTKFTAHRRNGTSLVDGTIYMIRCVHRYNSSGGHQLSSGERAERWAADAEIWRQFRPELGSNMSFLWVVSDGNVVLCLMGWLIWRRLHGIYSVWDDSVCYDSVWNISACAEWFIPTSLPMSWVWSV